MERSSASVIPRTSAIAWSVDFSSKTFMVVGGCSSSAVASEGSGLVQDGFLDKSPFVGARGAPCCTGAACAVFCGVDGTQLVDPTPPWCLVGVTSMVGCCAAGGNLADGAA
eukprot:12678030-Alexandrium_andersonii.AAC.1